MIQSEYGTTLNPMLKGILWILGVFALVWVFIMAGIGAQMMGSPVMGQGSTMAGMMTGGTMTGNMMNGGMMVVMTLTWLTMLGLVGVLLYLIVVTVRSRQAT
jgi:hypothetical protein